MEWAMEKQTLLGSDLARATRLVLDFYFRFRAREFVLRSIREFLLGF